MPDRPHVLQRRDRTGEREIYTLKYAAAIIIVIASLGACALAQPPAPESIMLTVPGDYPHGITSDGTHLWSTDYDARMLYCIDPSNGNVLDAFTTTNLTGTSLRSPRGCTWDNGTIWIATKDDLWQIDPLTTNQIKRLQLDGTSLQGLAYDGINLWVVDTNSMSILCIDPATGTTNTQLASPASSPRGVEFHDGSLWHVDSYQDRVYEMDPVTGETLSSFLVSRSGPRGIAWHGDRFWLIDRDSEPLPSIIGFTKADNGPHTRTTAYVSRGTVTCTFTNMSGTAFTGTHVYAALPQANHATDILSQRCFTNGVECTPIGLSTDEFGQVNADIGIGTVAIGEGVTVEIETIARLHNWTVNVDTNQVGDLATVDPDILTVYTRDEEMYGITDPVIIDHANAAVGPETNVFMMARLIHDYVINNLAYDVDSPWEQASVVLSNTNTSCSGYAFTMIALCRVHGIPARFAGGSECRSFETGRIDTLHHRWVEVYVPNYGWVPFDPTHDEPYPVGNPELRWREVGAQQRALVLRRGGGTNEMGWLYSTYARHDTGNIVDADRFVVWEGLPWDDNGDFDDDGILNSADAFAYDRAASVDTDDDGLPDDWNSGYDADDSTSVPPLVADDNDDNDGLTDAEEEIAGTDPADPASTLLVQALAVTGGVVELQWPSVSGRLYKVWITDALTNTSPTCADSNIAAEPPLNTYTSDLPAAPRFYRISVGPL